MPFGRIIKKLREDLGDWKSLVFPLLADSVRQRGYMSFSDIFIDFFLNSCI